MGPPEGRTGYSENQEGRRKQSARRPRMRRCLLKGCEQRFKPRHPHQRYCSTSCRDAARKWSRWRAQQRYRATTAGKEKRNGQSRCYRERARSRGPLEPEAVDEAARVITKEFFRGLLRPTRLLRGIRAQSAKPLSALLFARLPARCRASPRTRATLETVAHLIPAY
jgi:hypothetical protein